ncbi:MAG: radical SAM protein [uncultured bacterium]|nr:MAG: radical SAM protein [uncultured bacterium]
MIDILFLQMPVSFKNPKANANTEDTYPIGLAYIAAVLQKSDLKFRIINNGDAKYSIKDVLKIIESEKIKVVGFSTLLASIRTTVNLAKAIKNKFGNKVHTILGNSYVGIDPDIMDRYPYFDSAIDGEAENFITGHLVKILQGDHIRGIYKAEAPQDLDKLPFPEFERIENTTPLKSHLIPIISSRGCPFQCGYCARNALSRKVRARSGKNIFAEIKSRLKYSNKFFFQDDTATFDRKHIIDLCRLIIKNKIKIEFEIITRLDRIDEEMLSLLKKAGCTSLLVGIESGDEKIRNGVMRKGLTDKQIYKGMRITKKTRMPVQLFFMLGHPEETRKELMATVNFPLRLVKMGFNNIEIVGYHLTVPVPSTRYWDWCVKNKKLDKSVIDDYIEGRLGDGFFGHWPYLIPDGLTYTDLEIYRKLATKKFYLRLGYVYHRFIKDLKKPPLLYSDLKNAYHVITRGASSDLSKHET